ncbi:MAG: phosphate acyltransferase [Bryobacterales bacterium]
MSAFLDSIVERARKLQKRIVFPEGDDPRVREASARRRRRRRQADRRQHEYAVLAWGELYRPQPVE